MIAAAIIERVVVGAGRRSLFDDTDDGFIIDRAALLLLAMIGAGGSCRRVLREGLVRLGFDVGGGSTASHVCHQITAKPFGDYDSILL
jgi:hypothetical protein